MANREIRRTLNPATSPDFLASRISCFVDSKGLSRGKFFAFCGMFDSRLEKQMESAGVLAVLILESAEDAVPLARALLEGGIRGMELTLRTPAGVNGLVI